MGSIDQLDIPSLAVDAKRLAKSLHESCQYGAAHQYGKLSTETGMARLSLDSSDKEVRDWFMKTADSLGCRTFFDQMGNLFAIRSGKNKDAPPIMMGSHLDTQPTGGRYDGILGVLAGLEVLTVLNENSIETEGNVGVVNWTNEEGARFPKMAVSSGVWAEAIPIETAWELREGPILEDEGLKIGVVQGVQAFKWFDITVRGRDSHAGTTPLYARKDAVLSAAKMIAAANTVAKHHNGLATTGIIKAEPGTVNTMAHTAKFTLDVRHVRDDVLETMVKACEAEFSRISQEDSEKGCDVEWKLLVDSPAVQFNSECISVVEQSAAKVLAALLDASCPKLWRPMISGAGHDSCYTNLRCPTSMIFTPTRQGISHNPTEYCSPEDCALGASVLLGAVLRYDRLRASRGDF
ncbi:N-carbamoyl-L-amino acid hydrolase [Tolypocladium ophioglossoides CBS 100239]|uniref:N-carbamoyl-L-amino acid hydrolase n=1 Tax=Tolypocladium ophioglossoides (strain CBS 100239) TaxID=1163406 RepID=A0A0L0MY06_TOLOC|nr:N-carbamoyl-L-amino acid hydrolase [Tolypocladium ophioglossoides CBS 100239]